MVTLRKVELAEAGLLLDFSKKTFYDFFAHLNDLSNIDAYSATAFTLDKIKSELSDPNSGFYFAMLDGQVAGYLKLNFADAQTEFRDEKALEVERIYVSGEHHGKHIGRQLLNFAVDTAINKQFEYVWLGVWEHNQKAIGFYQHHGFEVFSSHEFLLGDDRQIDLLMRKML
ncbi:MAG TPA: GNAT family N-acetyltransferase [Mucilaginibacter sp.]|jgi:ribosomal protein S18 acetylase RimI-like enzyme|nr:GNAT family N-acetyltransferase [Mucilaginibacter sp.]